MNWQEKLHKHWWFPGPWWPPGEGEQTGRTKRKCCILLGQLAQICDVVRNIKRPESLNGHGINIWNTSIIYIVWELLSLIAERGRLGHCCQSAVLCGYLKTSILIWACQLPQFMVHIQSFTIQFIYINALPQSNCWCPLMSYFTYYTSRWSFLLLYPWKLNCFLYSACCANLNHISCFIIHPASQVLWCFLF